MAGPDTLDGMGTDHHSGWGLIAEHDGAAVLVAAALAADPDERYTRTELSERVGVAYKTLYVSDALEALVDAGLFARHVRNGDEDPFSVEVDGAVYRAAAAFDEVTDGRPQFESA